MDCTGHCMPRPPIKECQEAATKKLISLYPDEFATLVDEELAKRGWSQEIQERRVWTRRVSS